MNQEQTHDKCSHFTIINCPHRDEVLMKEFISDVSMGTSGITKQLDHSKAEEVDKKYCNPCTSFKEKRS